MVGIMLDRYVCPECFSRRCRYLNCDEHGNECEEVICCDCGMTAEYVGDKIEN